MLSSRTFNEYVLKNTAHEIGHFWWNKAPVASAGRQLLLALIFSIAGNRLARILNTGLSYGKVFTICVYAQTLAVFIMSVNTALGYLLSSFVVWIIALVVSMVFMNKAIGSYVSGDIPPGDVF